MKFYCHSDDKVRWKFKNGKLPTNAVVHIVSSKQLQYLDITSVQIENAGKYICEGDDYESGHAFYAEAYLAVTGASSDIRFRD